MGRPAARMGDMTAHGGVITLGFPTVLIGGQPAARVGDLHTCPMVTGIVPHVGGPILPPRWYNGPHRRATCCPGRGYGYLCWPPG